MDITLSTPFWNPDGLRVDSEHPLLEDGLGVVAHFTPYNPNCWSSQQNAKTSSNRLKNLGSAKSSLYFGAEPVNGVANLANAPTFENGKLLFNTGEGDRLVQGGGLNSDFSITNQATLEIFWIKPTNLGAEVSSLCSRHIGSLDSNFIFGFSSGALSATWIWEGDTVYTPLTMYSPLIQNNQLIQMAYYFEPNGPNSIWKFFVQGGQIGQETYTGKNALKYNSNTPPVTIGVRNAGETAQGYFYEWVQENITISGNNAAARVLLDYQEMAGFYASL